MRRASPSPALGKRVRRQRNRPLGSTNELGHNRTADVVAAFHGFPKFWLFIARCSHRPGVMDSATQKWTLVVLLPPATPANLATICRFEPAKPQLQLSIDCFCHETMLRACFLVFRSPTDCIVAESSPSARVLTDPPGSEVPVSHQNHPRKAFWGEGEWNIHGH